MATTTAMMIRRFVEADILKIDSLQGQFIVIGFCL